MMKRIAWIWLIGAVLLAGNAGAQDRSKIVAYKTTQAPVLDGIISPGEWDAAGPPIVVEMGLPGVQMNDYIAEDPYGGPEDLSFQFRVMWMPDWMVYFLIEVRDDIAMESDPRNLWERDQVEFFMDGNDPEGSSDAESFHWWAGPEPYGKFGVSRYNTFEGNPARMTDSVDNLMFDTESNFICCASAVGDTGVNANYIVEYAISLEPMWFWGTILEDTITPGTTKVKTTIQLSDDDNFDDGVEERSSDMVYWRQDAQGNPGTWDQSSHYADLIFTDQPPTSIRNWPVY
ncbi:MAG TPA: sugar-binding protein [bacterium]|nr:hypothetical protein [Candidatus Omnitrophota bacterium]HOL94080.1 sugar-binding protein [bacterium]HPP03056.1 sugar-binding protein [bacterium]